MWKGSQRGWGIGLAALIALTAACSEGGPAAPGSEALTSAELEQLAIEDEAFLTGFMAESFVAEEPEAAVAPSDGLMLSVEPIVREGEFSWTRTCPGGGEVKVEGSFTRELDREAGTSAVWVEGEKSKDDCVHERGDVEVTVDAEAQWEAHREWLRNDEGRWELVAATKWVEGEFSYVTSDEREGSCEFELHAEWDPEAHQVHVTGTYCGREIDRVIDRGGERDADA